MKHAALSKCFRAEFAKQPFVLRKKIHLFLKGIYFLNLCALLVGMGMITLSQETGKYHAEQITVTFGEQIWNGALVTTSSGVVERRTLLFSYFNGKNNEANLECDTYWINTHHIDVSLIFFRCLSSGGNAQWKPYLR